MRERKEDLAFLVGQMGCPLPSTASLRMEASRRPAAAARASSAVFANFVPSPLARAGPPAF